MWGCQKTLRRQSCGRARRVDHGVSRLYTYTSAVDTTAIPPPLAQLFTGSLVGDGSMKRQLLFEVGGYLFAVEAQHAREVLEPTLATPLPGAVPGVLGLINLRGTLMIAGHMATLFGLPGTGGEEATFLVLEREDRRVAMQVDRVVGLAPWAEGEVAVEGTLPEILEGRAVVTGVGEHDARPYYQLDMAAIFSSVLADDGDQMIQHGSVGGR